MISVIVPIYNVEKYLRKCVDSIINQTYQDLEIILVNDGSPDNCGQICDELAKKDKRITVIHQKNSGLSGARNKGLEVAKGEYIAFVDSDDFIESETYDLMLSMLEEYQSDIAICGYKIIEEGHQAGGQGRFENEILDQESLYDEIFGRLNNAVWNKLYRKSIIGELKFSDGIIHGEDLLFNLDYLRKCKSGVINRSEMYNYLKRTGSITKSKFSEKRFNEIVVKDRALKIVEESMPSQIKIAEKYCFKARMNVMRAIIKSEQEKKYIAIVNECRIYVKNHYVNVKSKLSSIERLEYYLSKKVFSIYKVVVRGFW